MTFDPRMTPNRPDLAARHLEGKVTAARFVDGQAREVVDAQAAMRRAPAPDAEQMTEALMGERVTIYEFNDEGWAWGQLDGDGYVGWLPANALSAPRAAPTHTVTALRTLAFPGPSIKLPPVAAPPFGSRLTVVHQHERFAVTTIGYVPANHLAPFDRRETDFIAIAERFLGTPYLWGGKTNYGLDCSGLVQVALNACGIACPRDSDMMERTMGNAIAPDATYSNLRRGDLVFWKGHMAIVRDSVALLHANAFHMAVAIEPIAEAIPRIAAAEGDVNAVKRL